MKKILTLLLLSTSFLMLPAQITHTATGTVDETAARVLKKATDKINSGAFTVTVTMVSYDAEKRETFRQKAAVTYKSPAYILKADDMEVYCDGKTIWQVNNNAQEVMITTMTTSDDDPTNPAALLANYQKNYRPKYIREEQDGTSIIDLQPKKGRVYHKLRFFIQTSTGRIKKIEQHNYDSSRIEYLFGTYSPAKLTAEAFKYTAPQGYETVDMR